MTRPWTEKELAAIVAKSKARRVSPLGKDVPPLPSVRQTETVRGKRGGKTSKERAKPVEREYKASDGEARLMQQMQLAGITDYVREHQFHPARRWRLDFAWPSHKLAVEVEGGTFSGGRHTRGTGYRRDIEKYNQLCLQGWHLLRFTTEMVKAGEATGLITDMLCGLSMAAKSAKIPHQERHGAILAPVKRPSIDQRETYDLLPPEWGRVK